MNIIAIIRNTIDSKGMKQVVVAERAGFTEQQFSNMLNGRKVIKAEYIPKIANALGVDVGDLFVDVGDGISEIS